MKNFNIIRLLIAVLFFTSVQAKAFVHTTARMSGIPVMVQSKSATKTKPCTTKNDVLRPVAATIKMHHFRYERKEAKNVTAYVLDWRLTKKHVVKPTAARPIVALAKMTIPVVRPMHALQAPARKMSANQSVATNVTIAAPRKVIYTAIATRKKKNIYFSFAAHVRNDEQLSKDIAFLFGGVKCEQEKVAVNNRKTKSTRFAANADKPVKDIRRRLAAVPRVPVRDISRGEVRLPHASKSVTMKYVYAAAKKHQSAGAHTKRAFKAFAAKQTMKPTILSTESGALAKATGKYDAAIETAVRAAAMFSAIKNVPVILIDNIDRPAATTDAAMTLGAIDMATGHSVVLKHNNWMDQFGPEMAMK